jgi:hypothetical protein
MNEGHNGKPEDPSQAPVELKNRRMHQFILQNQVKGLALQSATEATRHIIRQATRIGSPRQRHQGNSVLALLQMLDQLTVIQKPAGYLVQTAVYHKGNVHVRVKSSEFAANGQVRIDEMGWQVNGNMARRAMALAMDSPIHDTAGITSRATSASISSSS